MTGGRGDRSYLVALLREIRAAQNRVRAAHRRGDRAAFVTASLVLIRLRQARRALARRGG